MASTEFTVTPSPVEPFAKMLIKDHLSRLLTSSHCHQSIKLLKFTHDTTLIGLISGGESAYR